MATVSESLITAEEFFRMPEPADGSQQELVRGRVVTMPPPGGRHGVCCLKLGRRIGNYVEKHQLGTVASNDTGFITERNPDTVRGPDLSYWSRARLPQVPEGYIDIPPDLAVEIISPHDHYSRIQQKVRHYLNCGVRLVWVVDPEDRSITVYRSRQQATILEETDTLLGEDVLSGFSYPLAELFS
ncbi:MAG: Uma2 family endonuclease [Planctomycetes bacterium]|nr:Uma2 family endonuclease [Planctomycetota bacterium]